MRVTDVCLIISRDSLFSNAKGKSEKVNDICYPPRYNLSNVIYLVEHNPLEFELFDIISKLISKYNMVCIFTDEALIDAPST